MVSYCRVYMDVLLKWQLPSTSDSLEYKTLAADHHADNFTFV
jgi:hypothetical protein